MITSESFQPPLQLKGELSELDFTIDNDHRKRRRNRTTQSCLNCHTSKRKCDRKRPCQRCIQLGLTGLCVYEIDDPALRDDPTLDENTRLRNRIAELESLVRELRGKPHPRWAESNFRDGDPTEKWHSRATKSAWSTATKRRELSPDDHDRENNHPQSTNGTSTPSSSSTTTTTTTTTVTSLLASPIKTETISSDVNNPNLYRFSSSPTPSIRYHLFQADVRSSPTSSYDNDQQYGGAGGPPSSGYHSPSASTLQYTNNNRHSAHYSFDRCDEDTSFVDPPYNTSSTSSSTSTSVDISPRSSFCPCRASLASGHAFVALAQHLQSTLDSLRHYNLHPPNSPCLLYRRIVELINLIQITSNTTGGSDPTDSGPFDDLTTSTDNTDILTPHPSFHHTHSTSSGPPSSHEWQALTSASYGSYFHVPSNNNEHGHHHPQHTHHTHHTHHHHGIFNNVTA